MKIKLTVSYDGTSYCGWQVQPNGVSVQGVIENALFSLTGEKVRVTGSGRTDAGVHALSQVASFETANTSIPPENYAKALNTLLPPDVKVVESQKADDGFDARKSAKRKTYRYSVYFSDVELPLLERYFARVDEKAFPNVDMMLNAVKIITGKHDFKCFNAQNGGAITTVRTVYSVDIKQRDGERCKIMEFYVCGNGFLYNMVRTLVGTLLKAGQGKMSMEEVQKMLDTGDRKLCGKTMPSKGLTLYSVVYE